MSVRYTRALKRNHLCAALIAALVLPAAGAFAQDSAGQDAEQKQETQQTSTLDKVTVTGSRIKRVEIEGATPVTVITRDDIDREGFQTVSEMLDTLTQNTTINYSGDLSSAGGFTSNAQVVNLRGLGPGYTLVLINGRRMADYPQPYNGDRSSVNVGAIPSAIIERVEILSGGASAIYGSDAVAGVINVVLRENFEGNHLQLTTGTTTNGGGDSVDLQYTGGRTGDNWSVTYAFQYHNNEPIFASQRDFMDDRRDGPNKKAGPGLALAVLDAYTGREIAFPGAAGCEKFGFVAYNSPSRGEICGSYDDIAFQSIMNKRESVSGYGYGTYNLDDNKQLWASASWYNTDAVSSSGTEFWGTGGDPFMTYLGGGKSPLYYDPQFDTLVQLQRFLMPQEVGGETAVSTKFKEKAFEVAGGFRGTLADRFDWEVGGNYAKYDYKNDRPRLLGKALHDYFFGPLLGYAGVYPVYELNLDRYHTPFTPEQYRSVATRSVNRGETTSSQLNFNISGDLFELPAGAVGFAGTLEYARQTLDLESDPYASLTRTPDEKTPYNLVNSGETHGKRSRYAAGVELRVPIFDSLTAQLAGRYDKYDDVTAVDDAITYNLGLEWRPFSSLLVRGSYATSFRAPDLHMVYAEGYQFYSNAFDEYACRTGTGPGANAGPRTAAQCLASGTDPTTYQIGGIGTGNTGLKEEEGKSFTAGFVWDIVDNMSLSVDYYKIKLEDAARTESLSSVLEKEAGCRLGTDANGRPYPHDINSQFCQNVLAAVTRQTAAIPSLDGRLVSVATAPYNTADVETSGIDATYKYKLDTDRWGVFGLDLGYSLLLTDKDRQFREDELVDYRDEPSRYANQRSRARGSLSWSKGDWSTTVFGTRYGTAWSRDLSHRIQPLMMYNWVVSKKFGEGVTASFIVNNVFDKHYRDDKTHTDYPFYDYWKGADPVGRTLYARIDWRF
ncbi:TonB-dependent receptor plug domain-containing protein [Pseudoxanthomonas beigongshangi]